MTVRAQQLQLVFDADTDVGRSRQGKPNQDSVGTFQDFCTNPDVLAAKGRLFVVADGMGGAAGGKEASAMAVDIIFRSYYAHPTQEIVPSLERAIQAANTQIHQHGRTHPELRGMGTTVVLAVIRGKTLVVANVGDSRAYLLRNDELLQLSLDHTTVQEQVRSGILTPEEAATHPRRHVLSRNLGYRPQAQPDFDKRSLAHGDILLLCSDGLWGSVEDHELAPVLQQTSVEQAVDSLINLANDRGGPDNISAIVIQVGSVSATEQAAPAAPARLAATTEEHHPTDSVPNAALHQPHNTAASRGANSTGEPARAVKPVASSAATQRGGSSSATALLQQRRWLIAVAAAVVLLAIGAAYLAWWRPQANAALSGQQHNLAPVQTAPPPSSTASHAVIATTSVSAIASAASELTRSPQPAATEEPSAMPAQLVSAIAAAQPALLRLPNAGEVLSLALSQTRELLATGSADGTVRLWAVNDGELLGTFEADTAPITSLAFGPNEHWLASASDGLAGTIKLWALQPPMAASTELAHFQFHNTASTMQPFVTGLAFTDGKLAAVSRNTALSTWNLPLLDLADSSPAVAENASHVAIAADEPTLVIVQPNQAIQLRPANDHGASTLPWQPRTTVQDLQIAGDGQTVALVEHDGLVTVWQASGQSLRQRQLQPDWKGARVGLSHDGAWLAITHTQGAVEWWQVDSLNPAAESQPARAVSEQLMQAMPK